MSDSHFTAFELAQGRGDKVTDPMPQRNEAAQRLRDALQGTAEPASLTDLFDEALVAERDISRRATVERIRERTGIIPEYTGDVQPVLEAFTKLLGALDEEAAR